MSNKNFVDQMRPLMLLYHLHNAGIKNVTKSQDLDNTKESIEDWASKILEENKEFLSVISKEEFLNKILYGK